MSVAGLCGICERAEATYVCDRCGNPVCEAHYDKQLGLCTDCAAQVRAGRGETDRESESQHGDGTWTR